MHENFQMILLSVTPIRKTEVVSPFVSVGVYFKFYVKLLLLSTQTGLKKLQELPSN